MCAARWQACLQLSREMWCRSCSSDIHPSHRHMRNYQDVPGNRTVADTMRSTSCDNSEVMLRFQISAVDSSYTLHQWHSTNGACRAGRPWRPRGRQIRRAWRWRPAWRPRGARLWRRPKLRRQGRPWGRIQGWRRAWPWQILSSCSITPHAAGLSTLAPALAPHAALKAWPGQSHRQRCQQFLPDLEGNDWNGAAFRVVSRMLGGL